MNTTLDNKNSVGSRFLCCVALLVVQVVGTSLVNATPFAYVTNELDDTLSIIDTGTTPSSLVDTIAVGHDPTGGVVVSPDEKRVYITNINPIDVNTDGGGYVSVIDTTTTPNKVVDEVALGDHIGFYPAGLTLAPDGKRLYVINEGDSSLSVIDTTTTPISVVSKLALKPKTYPPAIAISPDGKFLYVPDSIDGPLSGNTISVIDTAQLTIVDSVAVGVFPIGLAVSPEGTRLYVTNWNSNSVSVVDTTTNSVVTTISVGAAPSGVAATADGKRVYVTNSFGDSVSVIDTTSNPNKLLATVPVGAYPYKVAITPDSKFAYVINQKSDDVSVIDTANNAVVDTISVGTYPSGIAMGPQAFIPFCEFDVQRSKRDRHHKNLFIGAAFTLGKTSDGIDPKSETVALKIGKITVTIPPGSFHSTHHGQYSFFGKIDNRLVKAKITAIDHNQFRFDATVHHANFDRIDYRLTVQLSIGNDTGTTLVDAHRRR